MARRIIAMITTLLISIALPIVTKTSAAAVETLVFGTYAFEKPTTTVRKLRPILNVLETELTKRLGRKVKVRMKIAPTYREAISDIIKGRVDFGRYGQAAYIFAKAANKRLKIITVEGDHKKKTFRSVIVVRKGSNIDSPKDLVGRSFAFGNEYSTTGRYFPQAFLVRHGITADKISRFSYLGRHDRVAWAVADGAFDAGAISEWVFKDLILKKADIRAIASFSNVTKPWVARAGLPADILQATQNSLMALRSVKILGRIKKDCFLPGRDSDFSMVRLAIANNWKFFASSTTK